LLDRELVEQRSTTEILHPAAEERTERYVTGKFG
jgi:ABC-type phosphate transport system ATPase subunit